MNRLLGRCGTSAKPSCFVARHEQVDGSYRSESVSDSRQRSVAQTLVTRETRVIRKVAIFRRRSELLAEGVCVSRYNLPYLWAALFHVERSPLGTTASHAQATHFLPWSNFIDNSLLTRGADKRARSTRREEKTLRYLAARRCTCSCLPAASATHLPLLRSTVRLGQTFQEMQPRAVSRAVFHQLFLLAHSCVLQSLFSL